MSTASYRADLWVELQRGLIYECPLLSERDRVFGYLSGQDIFIDHATSLPTVRQLVGQRLGYAPGRLVQDIARRPGPHHQRFAPALHGG